MTLTQRATRSTVARAGSPDTPPDELRVLLTSRRRAVWRALATNPATPADVLDELSHRPDEVPAWPSDGRPNISKHYWRVGNTFSYAALVAAHPNASPATLERLAASDSPHVREALAARG